MYELISIVDSLMTRYVRLRNCETGKIELCFDDSELCDKGQKDFGFMNIGEIYECLILLFGRLLKSDEIISDDCILCKQAGSIRKLDLYNIFPVESNGNIYYILEKDVQKITCTKEFIFKSSRKDLIKVNDVISARFLR